MLYKDVGIFFLQILTLSVAHWAQDTHKPDDDQPQPQAFDEHASVGKTVILKISQ